MWGSYSPSPPSTGHHSLVVSSTAHIRQPSPQLSLSTLISVSLELETEPLDTTISLVFSLCHGHTTKNSLIIKLSL